VLLCIRLYEKPAAVKLFKPAIDKKNTANGGIHYTARQRERERERETAVVGIRAMLAPVSTHQCTPLRCADEPQLASCQEATTGVFTGGLS